MGTIKAEDGSLIEQSKSHAAPDADLGNGDLNRRFTTVSASAGASGQILDGWRIGANVTRSARAPSAEELFANGPHAGTQAFEIGDPGLDTEKSWGAEAFLRYQGTDRSLEFSVFKSWFSNYIDQIATGAVEEDRKSTRLNSSH